MTTLYLLNRPSRQIAEMFAARLGDDPWAGGYVAPGKFAPVITAGRDFIAGPRPGGRLTPRLVPRLWGVMPPKSSDDPTRRVTTVRNTESPFWIGNLRNAEFRCLIPATAIMLWGSGTDYEGRRLRHWFSPRDGALFAMAGVWKDEEVPAFALLTRPATGLAQSIGAKVMPITLRADKGEWDSWLHGTWSEAERASNGCDTSDWKEIEAPEH